MRSTIRERLSDALLEGAMDRSIAARELEQNLATVSAGSPGYDAAHRAARTAHRMESVLLWLGWRLRPRAMHLN